MAVQIATEVRRPGEDKPAPFLVVIVNNPVLETRDGSGQFEQDPLDPRSSVYREAADHIEAALWGELPGQSESAFIDPALAARARLLRITVTDAPVAPPWCFVTQRAETLVGRLPDPGHSQMAITEFVRERGLTADVVFALSGAANARRASAWHGFDDRGGGFDTFELKADGVTERFRHHYWPQTPGVIAIHAGERSLTAVHEFSHAISTYNAKDSLTGDPKRDAAEAVNGLVVDLYRDDRRGLNKREVRPPPGGLRATFARYKSQGRTTLHRWDPHRPIIQYGAGWKSFHCEPHNPALPAIMDDYFRAPRPQQTACRHDTITRQFIQDRIAARMKR